MSTSGIDTEASAEAGPKPKRRRAKSNRSRRTQFLLELGGAIVAGLGAALLVRSGFGVSGVALPLIVGYLVFVVVIALSEFANVPVPGEKTEEVIDLTVEDDGAGEPAPVLAVVPEAEPAGPEGPRKQRKVEPADVAEFGVAVVGGLAFVELVRIVLGMQSTMGFVIWAYVAFIVLFFVLARDRSDAETGLDRVVTVAVWSVGIVVAAILVWMIVFIFTKGWALLTGDFFTHDLSRTGPLDSGGGAKHAIIGTLEQVGIATIVVVPVGIMTAVYLHEVRGKLASPVRFIVDAMSGLPSIVAGLLIFSVWVGRHGYSGIAGAAAIAVLMLPTMTRASEEILRTVPDSLREGALALGAPQWRLVKRVVLPTAIAGILTAMLLAIARAVGETAPMLLTAFGADNTNTNPNSGPQSDLPLFVWKLIRVPFKTQNDRAWTGALILVLLVFVLFTGARLIAARGQRRLGRTR